jgi:two-component system, OmpR family, KDP operon response regulator KdpE
MPESQTCILIVDDEPEIRRFLRASLKANQYDVIEAENGLNALVRFREYKPELVILDLGLPDMDGVEVTRRIRALSETPIIILSVRNREVEKIEALDAGADDYLTKPFGVGELLARMRVVLRRVTPEDQDGIYKVKNLTMDLTRHQVMVADQEILLTPTEFDLLRVLIQNAGKVMTHHQLIHKVWGTAYEDESRLLRVNISNLRRKIEPNPEQPCYILTELGVGYRLSEIS